MNKYFEWSHLAMNSFRRLFGLTRTPLQGNGQDPTVNVTCSEFEVNNWVVSEFLVSRLVPAVGIHPFPVNELFLMVAAVCRLKPTHIFEWGTHLGKSARVFYETGKYFGLGVEIHSVDLPDEIVHREHPGQQRGILVKGLRGVHLHQGDGLTVSLEIHRRISKPAKTLVFLDGDHRHGSVKRELDGIMTNLPEADILLHDTFFQSEESGYNIGPYQAVTEALSAVPNRYKVLSTNMGLPGMTLLYRLT
jgi:cephalosporin hydroxylase